MPAKLLRPLLQKRPPRASSVVVLMGPGKVVERLRRHYDENVLPISSTPSWTLECLKKRLENPETFEKLVADGLARHFCNDEDKKINESDVNGSKLLKIDAYLPMIVIGVPEEKAVSLIEKCGHQKGTRGFARHKDDSSEESPFRGIYVAVVTNGEFADVRREHEELHVMHMEKSRSKKYLRSSLYWNSSPPIKEEMYLLGEIMAYGVSEWDKDEQHYKKRLSQQGLPERLRYCPIPATSESVIKTIIKLCNQDDEHGLWDKKIDDGVDAFKVLYENLPKDVVTRIFLSCGPTREEFESGSYTGPIDELILWSRHYKEVLEVRSCGQ